MPAPAVRLAPGRGGLGGAAFLCAALPATWPAPPSRRLLGGGFSHRRHPGLHDLRDSFWILGHKAARLRDPLLVREPGHFADRAAATRETSATTAAGQQRLLAHLRSKPFVNGLSTLKMITNSTSTPPNNLARSCTQAFPERHRLELAGGDGSHPGER